MAVIIIIIATQINLIEKIFQADLFSFIVCAFYFEIKNDLWWIWISLTVSFFPLIFAIW